MFDNISGRYDFLNHFLSLGIDKRWRRRVVNELPVDQSIHILDVATGTGDLALAAMKLPKARVTGVDISEGMLAIGRRKINERNYADRIELHSGDSENLPFPENNFDVVTVGFGVRNFEHLDKGLSEICRVLKPGGRLVVLEFSKPDRFPFKQFYRFYFNFVLPKIGRWFSTDKAAYSYLPESVQQFPDGREFIALLNASGFKETKWSPLTFGISSIYTGRK